MSRPLTVGRKKTQWRSAGSLIFAFQANLVSLPLTGGRWEAEEQVDLEWFDPERFFAILLGQSVSVTTKLGQTKEEVSGSSWRSGWGWKRISEGS